jgi:putative tributyrin esterase
MKKTFLILFLTAFLSFAGATASARQSAAPLTPSTAVTNAELDSKLMGRKTPYRVVLPTAYEKEKAARFRVLYLLHGLGGNYKNWTDKFNLELLASSHRIIIVTPEGANGWYSDSATQPNDKFETYIVQELIAEVDRNYRTVAGKNGRAVAGLSMGGFGALKFGAKYPEMFALAASMSGAVQIASWQTAEQIPPMFRQMILATFGAADSRIKKENDLFRILGEMPPEKVAALPFFYLDCGTEDELGLLQFNQQFAAILAGRKIPHEFRQLPGRHNWAFWNQQVQEILRVSDRVFASAPAANAAAATLKK